MNLDVNLGVTLPVLAPLAAAVLVLLVDAALPRQRVAHLVLTAVGLVAGAAAAVPGLSLVAGDARRAFCAGPEQCWYAADRLASALQLGALGGALVVLVLAWREWAQPSPHDRTAVVTALLLGATAGTAALPAGGDLGTLLVALELATIPTVALVALTDHRWSSERRAGAVDGAIALLTTSLVSFGLLAMGVALWVAATGSAMLTRPVVQVVGGSAGESVGQSAVQQPGLLVLAAVFVLAGLAFKLSAVPFHAWTPLTYAAAPLPITAYLATVSKVAALGALVIVVRALGMVDGATFVAVAVLAALSMTVGNLVALVQTDSVRLLAWSTVAQAGWVLLPLASISSRAVHAASSYLLVYLVATLLAFVVVIVVATSTRAKVAASASASSSRSSEASEALPGSSEPSAPSSGSAASSASAASSVSAPSSASAAAMATTSSASARSSASAALATTSLESHRGLLRSRPLLALPLALALFTLAGLPPGIAGLVAKVVALRPVVADATWWLAVVAAVNVALGIAVYLRWLVILLAPVPRVGAASHAVGAASHAEAGTPEPATIHDLAMAQRPAGTHDQAPTQDPPITHGAPDAHHAAGVRDQAGEGTSGAGQARTKVWWPWWALVAALTVLLVLGSIVPVGII